MTAMLTSPHEARCFRPRTGAPQDATTLMTTPATTPAPPPPPLLAAAALGACSSGSTVNLGEEAPRPYRFGTPVR